MISRTQKILIYFDGSCINNPGTGGWAFAAINQDQYFIDGDQEQNTTNNKMELTAVYKALEYLKCHDITSDIEIFVDSLYVKNGITIWSKTWRKNNWRLSNKAQVKNQELWKKIIELEKCITLSWNWVKGHNIKGYSNTEMEYHAIQHDKVDKHAKSLALDFKNQPR